MEFPSFESYVQRGKSINALVFEVPIGNEPGYCVRIWFSYRTVVAFCAPGLCKTIVCENIWGRTTGGHLNAIDRGNKSGRLARPEFERRLDRVLRAFSISLPKSLSS